MNILKEFYFFSTEIMISCGILFLVVLYLILKNDNNSMNNYRFFLIATIVLFGAMMNSISMCWIPEIRNYFFAISPFEIWTQLILICLTWCIIAVSYNYFIYIKSLFVEFLLLVFVSLLSFILLIKANHLMSFYFCVELQSIALYILIGLRKNSIYTIEASLKYFVFSVLVTSIGLFGIGLLYSCLGTLSFSGIGQILDVLGLKGNIPIVVYSGMYLIIFSVLFKLAIVPFHVWIADVYSGSNLASICFIATLPKIVFLVVLLRLLTVFGCFEAGYLDVLLTILGVLSIIIGSVVGLYQYKVLRLLAFSAITHMGYILIAVSLQTVEGLVSALLSIFIYSITMIGIFGVLMAFSSSGIDPRWQLKFISDLPLLPFWSQSIAVIFILLILSLAGIPPLAGFGGKLMILKSILEQGDYLKALLIFFISIVSAAYYIRLVRFIYFDVRLRFDLADFQAIPLKVSFIVLIIVIFTLFFFPFIGFLFHFIMSLILKSIFL